MRNERNFLGVQTETVDLFVSIAHHCGDREVRTVTVDYADGTSLSYWVSSDGKLHFATTNEENYQ